MIRFRTKGSEIKNVKQSTFPGGEVKIDIGIDNSDGNPSVDEVIVDARVRDSADFMALAMATDALRRAFPYAKFVLSLPYVPYARQDRVCNPGESLSIKVFADLLNSLKYDAVVIIDPHSIVTPACINNVCVVSQYEIFGEIIPNLKDTFIVAPDQGALKKTEEFARLTHAKGIVSFTKHRELSTGKITGIALNTGSEIYPGQKYLVLDDICDGGRTFLELVPFFDGVERLDLAVTHGIFSKGVKLLTDMYDTVYTTDSFPQEPHERLIVQEL